MSHYCVGLVILCLCWGGLGAKYSLQIGGDIVGTSSENYLSVTIDMNRIVTDDYVVFSTPYLINLAKALSPCYLRIGGTTGDETFYDMTGSYTTPPSPYKTIMNNTQWDTMNYFAKEANMSVIFGLNNGPGSHSSASFLNETLWNSTNAQQLINYTISMGYPIYGWELGNEPNLYPFNWPEFSVTPENLVKDFEEFIRTCSSYNMNWKLFGADLAYQIPLLGDIFPDYLEKFLSGLSHDGYMLDVITWHWYPTMSSGCLAGIENPWHAAPWKFLNPLLLDQSHFYASHVQRTVMEYMPTAELWLGETGPASCGGQPGVSNAFVDSFWWLDQLGGLSAFGNQVQARQSLLGGYYGLVNETTLVPTPDYWASYMWSTLMGNKIFNCSSSRMGVGRDLLRTYAQCSKSEPGALTLLAINLSTDEQVSIDTNQLGFAVVPREEYIVTGGSSNAELSPIAFLNGELLQPNSDGTPPALSPNIISNPNDTTIHLEALSYGFFVFSAANVKYCSP